MTIANFLARVRRFMSVNTDNPEQLRAQLTALSRLIPLLYFILVANAWVLAATFFGKARTGSVSMSLWRSVPSAP